MAVVRGVIVRGALLAQDSDLGKTRDVVGREYATSVKYKFLIYTYLKQFHLIHKK